MLKKTTTSIRIVIIILKSPIAVSECFRLNTDILSFSSCCLFFFWLPHSPEEYNFVVSKISKQRSQRENKNYFKLAIFSGHWAFRSQISLVPAVVYFVFRFFSNAQHTELDRTFIICRKYVKFVYLLLFIQSFSVRRKK